MSNEQRATSNEGRAKQFLFLLCLLVPMIVSAGEDLTPASGWYLRADAGYASASDPDLELPNGPHPGELGNSPVFGGGLGYSLVPGIRFDWTLTFRNQFEQVSAFPNMPVGRADFESTVSLVSMYLDVLSTSRISPYGGFGIGFSHNELQKITITNLDGSLLGTIDGKSKNDFAWQLCGGVSIQLSNRWLLDAGYHRIFGGEYESEATLVFADGTSAFARNRGEFNTHEFVLSLHYWF